MKIFSTTASRLFLCSFLIVLTAGCSGGQEKSPVAPNDITSQISFEYQAGSTHQLWMYSNIYIDPESLEYEVIPVRQPGAHWNVLNFLEKAPCDDCLKVLSIAPSGTGSLLVAVQISHPFPNPKFTGFDVRGIAMFNGSMDFPEAGKSTQKRYTNDGYLLNADGYTSLYNSTTAGSGPGGLQGYAKGKLATPTAPNADINGYKRYISDFDPANTRNAFYAGGAIDRTFDIKMPTGGPFVLGYAVDASWAAPTVDPVVDPMTDFPQAANCPEPWKIEVSGDTLLKGGQTTLTIDVYDYEGKSTHDAPVIESPDLFNTTVTATWIMDGTGFARYEATIYNSKNAEGGDYMCLIGVEANENNPGSTPWLDLTAYQLVALQTPIPTGNLIWAKRAGGVSEEAGLSVARLSDDSFVITGYYVGPSTFGQGEINETTLGAIPGPSPNNIFIARYNPDSSLIWAKRAGGAGEDAGHGVVALSDDSIIVTGAFSMDGTFGEGESNETILTAAGGLNDVFVAKYDNNGSLVWAKRAGGTSNDIGMALTRLSGDGVAVTGFFYDAAIFGEGEPLETPLTAVAGNDIFVAWYASDGSLVSARSDGGTGQDSGNSIGTMSNGTVLVSGDFAATATFGLGEPNETSFDSNGATDFFFAHYDLSGNLDWVKRTGGGWTDSNADLAILPDDSFALTGSFSQIVIFGEGEPNETQLQSFSGGPDADIYIGRYNPNGTLQWVKKEGAVGSDYGQSVTVLSGNSVVVTGNFMGTVTFGTGEPHETIIDCASGLSKTDIFVARYRFNGSLYWAKRAGGIASDIGYGITTLSDDTTVATGKFGDTGTFGPGEINETDLVSAGGADDPDVFVARFEP